jgi:glycosyltransferase involved in cell wall biosynthesis
LESFRTANVEIDVNSRRSFTIARLIARLNVGGPATQAILMTEAFQKKGYRALLLTGEVPPGEGSMETLAYERGLQPIKINTLSRKVSPGADLKSLWRLIRLFRRERPMIVHTHTAKAGTLGRLAAMVTRVPVRVHTFHGHVFEGYFSRGLTRIFLAIERFLGRHTDCIIAVSRSQRKDLVETYKVAPPDKVVTIPLGFDLDPFLRVNGQEGSLRAGVRCNGEAVVVGWIGRLTAIKGPDLFLESARRILAASASVKFVMVGDGELRQDCESHIRRAGLQDSVVLAGWKRDLVSVYSDLDLLLLTSINEGTPLTLLEAMASGRPFIATDVGGVRDLMVGSARPEEGWERFGNGILVPRDSRRIAEAAQYLLSRPELRREMGSAGREFVRTHYSQHRLAADLERLYVQLARKKKCLEEGVEVTPILNQQLSKPSL